MLGAFTGFTCASGHTNTYTSGNAGSTQQAQRSDRQERANAFAEATANRALVATLSLKRLLGNTGDLFDLLACGLLGVLGQQRADASSCGLHKANGPGNHALEEFLDVATDGGLRLLGRALTRFGQAPLNCFAALLAFVSFGGEDQALLRSTFWPLNLVGRAVRCGDLIQRHGQSLFRRFFLAYSVAACAGARRPVQAGLHRSHGIIKQLGLLVNLRVDAQLQVV